MKLPLLEQDKANHIVYGFVIYYVSNLFLNEYYSLGITLIFALSKEVKDEYKYRGFDLKDLLVTMLIPTMLFIKELIINKYK
jgi:hypothetical protein